MLSAAPKSPKVCTKDDGGIEKEQTLQDKIKAKANLQKSKKKSSANQPAYSTKIGLIHVTSNQPIYDDEYYENLASEKMVVELIKYLQDAWKVHIDKKSSLIEITYRTLDMMYHKKPVNHWLIKRARQKISDYTGFFSNVRKKYDPLGVPELDTPTLVFRNLPERLKIESLEWFLELERREEEEKRRNAPLPKLPREKMIRPKYSKGRIRKGAGGTEAVDKFVHTADAFQKEIRGSMTFTKLLAAWKQSKEDESAHRGSPFGILHNRTPVVHLEAEPFMSDTKKEHTPNAITAPGGKRQSSTLDDRVYQHQMLHLEKMMLAMYDMLKSLLNMKPKQLKSQYRLPLVVVMSLRDRSPESKLRHKVVPKEILNRSKRNPGAYKSLLKMDANSTASVPMSSATIGDLGAYDFESATRSTRPPSVDLLTRRKYRGTGHAVPDKLEEEDVREILPMDDPCDTAEKTENIQYIRHIIKSPSYLDDRPPELKSTTLKKETAHEASKRGARNDHRYRIFFDRQNVTTPVAQWHEVKLEAFDFNFGTGAKSGLFDEKKSVRDFAMLDFSARNRDRDELPFSDQRPDPDEIPTPKLPNSQSIEVLDAEEQSRLNLLAKCPGADSTDPIPRDIQRLYAESGIRTTTRDMFTTIMKMKKSFSDVEKNVRTYYLNEIEKFEWNTMKRYRTKVAAIQPSPVFEWSIAEMRQAMANPIDDIDVELDQHSVKRPSVWYKNLLEKLEDVGGMKHHGCKSVIIKLHKYCDIDTKSRPNMLNRFCLLVLSLPTTELGTPHFQEAVVFLLDRLFGSPKELFYQWLLQRGLPILI